MHVRHLVFMAALAVFLGRHPADGKRVVIVPMPYTSHTNYLTQVARALARLGHQVWLTMPDYIASKGVLDTSNFTVIDYRTFTNVEEELMTGFRDNYFKGLGDDWDLFFRLSVEYCNDLLTNSSFFEQIRDLRPEFFVLDNLPTMKMLTIIPYRLGVPFAFLGTAYDPNTQRIPLVPCNTPVPMFNVSKHMNFFQRVVSSLIYISSSFSDNFVYKDAVSRYAPEMPYLPIDMLVAKAEIWLVESDHILDYPKPCMPNVKLIGGTATGPAKPLTPKFRSFMDAAEEGVVIVTFGSYVLSPPQAIVEKLLSAFKELPFKFIFRSNVSSPDPDKILTSSWIPQNDLLAHPNTRVFVSHCGKNGQYEALYHAVPVVATPIFADQLYNAERMRVKGFAETVDLNTVSADDLRATILKVATNTSYKQAITKASELFKIEFGVPTERAAFWLDHVMKYGGAHMRSAGHEIPFYLFSCWDVYVFFLAVVLTAFLIAVLFLCALWRCLCGRSKLKKE